MNAPSAPALLIRVDGGGSIGFGHAMRCLALAQAWQAAGGNVHFVSASLPQTLQNQFEAHAFHTHGIDGPPGAALDLTHTLELANAIAPAWIVLDGYHFSADYQQDLCTAKARVLVIDDHGKAGRYASELVLDQNLHAEPANYARAALATRLLLGSRYALLRREFTLRGRQERVFDTSANKLLVTFGGSNLNGAAQQVIHALSGLQRDDLLIRCVGAGADSGLKSQYGYSENLRIEGATTRMAELMAWADVAVCGAGSACWELAYMGTPAVVCVTAENQRLVAERLHAAGIAINSGWLNPGSAASAAKAVAALLDDPQRRRHMSNRGQTVVDGKGAERVVRLLKHPRIHLRLAGAADCRLLWQWRNDPQVRGNSFSTDVIPYDAHAAWFEQKQGDASCRIYIAEDEQGTPVGQIRFNVNDGEAEVHISVAAQQRGNGFAATMLQLGLNRIYAETPVAVVRGLIRPENTGSIQSFEHALFQPVNGRQNALEYQHRRTG